MGVGIGIMQHCFSLEGSRGKESKMYRTKPNATGLINNSVYWRKLNFSKNLCSLPFKLCRGITARNLQK